MHHAQVRFPESRLTINPLGATLFFMNSFRRPTLHSSKFRTMTSLDTNLLRYKLIVSYDGTRYRGFQTQKSGESLENNQTSCKRRRFDDTGKAIKTPLTIQDCIESALENFSGLDRNSLKVRFAGRTDAGVHARGQVLAVSLPANNNNNNNTEEMWQIQKSINSRLPIDISIDTVSLCDDNFDPRFDVKLKRYSYTIKYRKKVFSTDDGKLSLLPVCSSGPNTIRNALDPSYLWIVPWALYDSKLDQFCRMLTGDHDYTCFVHKKSRREKSNVLTLDKLSCKVINQTEEDAPVLTVQFVFEAKVRRYIHSTVLEHI